MCIYYIIGAGGTADALVEIALKTDLLRMVPLYMLHWMTNNIFPYQNIPFSQLHIQSNQ